ncbi:MAG: hypothetical protein ACYDCO_14410 [Armatimonadota bacterium]
MSYERYIYSPNPQVPSLQAMREALQTRGWALHFIQADEVAETFTEMTEGDPAEASSVFMWPLDAPEATALDDTLSRRDYQGFLDAYEDAQYGGCVVWPSPFTFSEAYSEDELSDLQEYRSEEQIDAMRQARMHYTLRNGGFMLDTDLAAQGVLWLAVGELTGGFLEDDQIDQTLFSHEINDAHYAEFLTQFRQFQVWLRRKREEHTNDDSEMPTSPAARPAPSAASSKSGDPSLIIISAAVFAGLMTVLGLRMIFQGINPLTPEGWYLFAVLAHAPIGIGLLLRLRWTLPAGLLLCLLMAGIQIYLLLATGNGLFHFSGILWIAFYLFAFSRLASAPMINAFYRQ